MELDTKQKGPPPGAPTNVDDVSTWRMKEVMDYLREAESLNLNITVGNYRFTYKQLRSLGNQWDIEDTFTNLNQERLRRLLDDTVV